MIAQTGSASSTVVVDHDFHVPPEQVFDAWLDPANVRRWLFATPGGSMQRTDINARVGGRFNVTERRNGDDIEHVGEYLAIDRPRKLVFTFSVPKFSSVATRVTVDIAPNDLGCKLTLTHENVLPEYIDRTRQGWSIILGNLAKTIQS